MSRANRQTRLKVFDVSPRPDLQRLLFLGRIIEALIHSWFCPEARTEELASWEIRNWLNSIKNMYQIYSPFHFLYDLSSICRIEENWIIFFMFKKRKFWQVCISSCIKSLLRCLSQGPREHQFPLISQGQCFRFHSERKGQWF